MFVNLIGNAADAMSETEGGALRLTISPVTRGGADYWRCDVSDTGLGMPADVLEQVFDSFFTTIEVDSEVGVGTTFRCTSGK